MTDVTAALARLGWGHSPLVRRLDRVQGAALLAAVLLALVAVPIAITAGQLVHERQAVVAAAESGQRYRISAVLSANVPLGTDQPEIVVVLYSPAVWELPDGQQRTGRVPAPSGSVKGETVEVWVDANGRLVPAPLAQEQARWQGVLTTVLSMIGVVAVLAALFGLVSWWLDRARSAEWARKWATVEPFWSGR
jgi:hypothetical protein